MWLIDESSLNLCVKSLIDFGVKEARFLVLYLNRYFLQKKYKNKGFGSNFFRKMRKSSYFNTKYLDFKNYLYKIRHYYVVYTKVINRTSIKSFREAVTQQKRTTPPGVAGIRVWGRQSFLRGF